jgi:hypothetical protein
MALDEDEIRSVLQEMLSAGSRPPAPITASELRGNSRRRDHPWIDVKALVAVAAVVALLVVLFTAGPLKSNRQSAAHVHYSPSGWTAHSAYGLQISAPRDWTVEVFGQCRDGRKPGTLIIGTSNFVDQCPAYGSNTTQVDMFMGGQIASASKQSQVIRVNGLEVLSSPAGAAQYWYVPSKHVIVTGANSKALAIMRTLAPATPQAFPAVGQVDGSEYVEALTQVPVSGQITIRRIGSKNSYTVQALNGSFSFGGKPGNYLLTGSAGGASCPSVIGTVLSGQTTNAPPIKCEGA